MATLFWLLPLALQTCSSFTARSPLTGLGTSLDGLASGWGVRSFYIFYVSIEPLSRDESDVGMEPMTTRPGVDFVPARRIQDYGGTLGACLERNYPARTLFLAGADKGRLILGSLFDRVRCEREAGCMRVVFFQLFTLRRAIWG
jgi:hypothetical protein